MLGGGIIGARRRAAERSRGREGGPNWETSLRRGGARVPVDDAGPRFWSEADAVGGPLRLGLGKKMDASFPYDDDDDGVEEDPEEVAALSRRWREL